MSVSLFNQNLKEARRDALVSHYLATHDFSSLPDGSSVTTAEDLYEYLLLDTKISNAVTTTRLAEAVSSLQLFIHRALEGYEGELAETATQYLAQDAFLNNWDQYNKRYSTWAGKEKLRFYAGNYVEPSLRVNKSQLFKQLEANLNQGKLTSEMAVIAVNQYLDSYNELSEIRYFSGCKTASKIYFFGRRFDSVNSVQFYWREAEYQSDGEVVLWGDWVKLTLPLNNVKVISPYVENGVVFIECSEEIKEQDSGDTAAKFTYVLKHFVLINGKWIENQEKEIVGAESVTFRNITPYTVTGDNLVIELLNNFPFIQIDALDRVNIEYINNDSIVGNSVSFSISSRYDNFEIIIDGMRNNYVLYAHDSESIIYIKFESIVNKNVSIVKAETQEIVLNFDVTPSRNIEPLTGNIHGNRKESIYDYREDILSDQAGIILFRPVYAFVKNDFFYDVNFLYNFSLQESLGQTAFYSSYGQYLWEIFFHIPYLVATRFATEQRFEEAERWYKFIFNSTGYRDEDGHNLTGDNGQTRYWNCYPLQQDAAWDSFTTMPASTDPDVIATADPMHYKLAIFQHTLDLLIARGDAAYRLLERDTLTEAKMYYVQALQLLGPRPDIRVTNTWDNPTLSAEADAIQIPATRSGEGSSLTFAQWLRAGDTSEMGDGNFLPPYNDVLLAYWDKLDIRLYNLRHNLSLDGQPLNLPLFATPVDPTELLRQQSGGDGVQEEGSLMSLPVDTGWRYPRLADNARFAVGVLMQFGNTLLGALERRDGEQLALLMQTQQIAVLGLQQDIAQKNLDSLNASIEALNAVRSSAEMRKNYYDNLINGDLSAAEIAGLTLHSTAMATNVASLGTLIAAGALSATPNIFGLADGGGDWGAPLHAATQGTQIAAMAQDQSATISEITANYQRRKEDWLLQRDLADKDIIQSESQTESLKAQIAMQHKQITLAEMESANAQAVYDLQSSRFTGQVLYNWMVSRLSTLYYQLYDATIPVCIQAREALKRELGNNRADGVFSTPVWNDLYQGLLAGEGLTTELQKLENVWIQNSANGLEATRTVSLAMLRNEESGSLSAAIGNVLGGISEADGAIGQLKLDDSHIFSAVLDMSVLQLTSDYGLTSSSKNLFIKSIAVTLPTLLGPYQDIAATLSDNKGSVATLSHGMQDAGRFVVNFDDSRFLPFEGMDPTQLTLTLSIFNVKEAGDAAPNQRSIVENLSDIIFHIRYIMRDK